MNNYTVDIQVNTSGSIFTDGDNPASEFHIKGFTFIPARHDFDRRAGQRYFVKGEIQAESYSKAFYAFREKLTPVVDSLAYYYSQPFSLEYWNCLVKKENIDAAWLSVYEIIPATTMTDYSMISPRIDEIIDRLNEDEDLQNVLWLYNNIAKIDGVDYDPSSHQFGLCQLIEALAEVEHVPACSECGRGAYDRPSRSDIESMLGRDLMKKLYLGSDSERLRNRLGHGRLVGARFLTNEEVEDVILRINQRIKQKYSISNVVDRSMTDRIRGIGRWFGAVMGIDHQGMNLEDCLNVHHSSPSQLLRLPINTQNE